MQSLKEILFAKSVFTKLSHLRENFTALPTFLSGKSTEYFRILFAPFWHSLYLELPLPVPHPLISYLFFKV